MGLAIDMSVSGKNVDKQHIAGGYGGIASGNRLTQKRFRGQSDFFSTLFSY